MITAFIKRNSTWILAVIVLITIVISSSILEHPHGLPDSESQPDISVLWDKAPSDMCNVNTQHDLISLYYNTINNGGYVYNQSINQYSLRNLYDTRTSNADSCTRDVCNYALGYVYLLQSKNDLAYSCFKHVVNRHLKYLNNSLGILYSRTGEPDSAAMSFKNEIAEQGYMLGAVSNLYDLYKDRREYTKCKEIIEDKALSKYLDYEVRTGYDVAHFRFIQYSILVFNDRILNTPLRLTIVSLLVVLVWLIYLFLVDLNELRESWKIGLLFIAGAAFVFPCLFIYDAILVFAHWNLNKNLLNDFFYCIFAIGCNEELVKVLPVIIVALCTKWIKEPYTIIIYVSASALGFAFMEDLGYFKNEHFGTVFNRSLISVVSHMIYSSICVYGWILAKYKYKKPRLIVPYFLISFFIAACLHGIIDYILIDGSVFAILAIMAYISLISVWVSIISNCINNSPYYTDNLADRANSIKIYILTCLTGILLIDYLKSSYAYGAGAATSELLRTARLSIFIMGSLAFNLSKLHLMQGKWFSIKLFSMDRDNNDVLGLGAIISSYVYNDSNINSILPINGSVTDIVRSSVKHNEWLKITFDAPVTFSGQTYNMALIRVKSNSKIPIDDKDIRCYLMLPVDAAHDDITDKTFDMKAYIFYGWAIINFIRPTAPVAIDAIAAPAS